MPHGRRTSLFRGGGLVSLLLAVVVGLAVGLPLVSSPHPAAAVSEDASSDVIRVAFCPLNGFFEYDSQGARRGYGVDLLSKVSKESDLRFDYVAFDSWAEAKQAVIDGDADLCMPSSSTVDTTSDLSYSSESIMQTYQAIMTLASNDNLFFNDTETFPSIKVAVQSYEMDNADVVAYLAGVGIDDGDIVRYDSFEECRAALDSGQVDGIVANVMNLEDDLKVVARFEESSSYAAMRSGDTRLTDLDSELAEIKMENPTILTSLFTTWYPSYASTPFTRDEAEFIKTCGTIEVGQIANRLPMSYVSSDTGELVGINEDVLSWISRKTGLTFESKKIEEGTNPIDALKAGQFDMVEGVMETDQLTSDTEISLSTPYASTGISVVKLRGYSYDPDASMTAAITSSFRSLQVEIAASHPNITIVTYKNAEECLDAVASGEADISLQNVYSMDYYLQKPAYDDLMIIPTSFTTENSCLATLSTADPRLVTIIDKAIQEMPEDELDAILMTNSATTPYHYTLADTLYKYRLPILAIAILLGACVTMFLVLLVNRQRSLHVSQVRNVQLADALAQAQVASRAKGDFLARMSHEIRTPLNAVIGMSTLAHDDVDEPAKMEDDLDKIDLSSQMLLSTINDVLDMSAIESDKIRIAHEPFDLDELILSLDTVYYAQCQQKGIDFDVTSLAPAGEWFAGDQLRLSQVLNNLLSNAVKFTDQGGVTMTVLQTPISADRAYLEFKVSDTGCGMSEEALGRLFQPFEQESASTARRHGGSGLGLAIAQNLVDLMHGDIQVTSTKDIGSTFVVTVPLEISANGPEQTVDHDERPDLSGCKALVVEDNEMNRIVAVGLLGKANITCDTATNGQEALDLFCSSEAGTYDVILMDLQMPVMDGYEATKAIRACEHPDAKTVPIIAMTANAFSEDLSRALGCGMDDRIVKPIDPHLMFNTLANYLEKR